MPGGRLTPQERQQITLGLADGLPYAEIARRLGRPTSTVTREIMRNGGPTAYRADLAQHATERRARGRRKATPRHPGAPAPSHGRDADAVREYEETFATVFIQLGGIPAGRVPAAGRLSGQPGGPVVEDRPDGQWSRPPAFEQVP